MLKGTAGGTSFKGTALSLIALAAAHSAIAMAELTEAQASRIESNVETIKNKLNMSDEQSAQLEAILISSIEQRIAIMDEYGFDPEQSKIANVSRLGMQKMRAMQKAVKEVETATQSQVEGILDDEQISAYEKMTK